MHAKIVYIFRKKVKKKQCIWRITEPLACYDKVCTMFKRKKGGINESNSK